TPLPDASGTSSLRHLRINGPAVLSFHLLSHHFVRFVTKKAVDSEGEFALVEYALTRFIHTVLLLEQLEGPVIKSNQVGTWSSESHHCEGNCFDWFGGSCSQRSWLQWAL